MTRRVQPSRYSSYTRRWSHARLLRSPGPGQNGILVLTSITGGDAQVEIPGDKVNLDFVLHNKVMFGTVNANREYFELGVKDFAHSQSQYPGWLQKLLSHPVKGLEEYEKMMHLLSLIHI